MSEKIDDLAGEYIKAWKQFRLTHSKEDYKRQAEAFKQWKEALDQMFPRS